MDPKNIFSLTHQSDIDGVGSAALIKMRYGIPGKNMFFADYSPENVIKSKIEITKAAKEGAVLIIADLGLNEATKQPMLELIKNIKNKNGSVYWFDHHMWKDSWIKEVASKCDAAIVNENAKYCATEIVRNELSLNSAFCKRFAQIVHYSDFNLRPKNKAHMKTIIEYAMSITSYSQINDYSKRNNKLRHIAEVISEGRLSDGIIRRDALRFDKTNTARIKEMVSRRLIVIDKVAVGFQKRVNSTLAGSEIIKRSGKDIAVYINTDDLHGHIRTKKADCVKLANYFGGGGHPHAAGFTLKKKYDFSKESERRNFAILINKKAKELC
jgi:oligoribonuclease NrnB/cAMP/cGMP phosphodiesterase (DHH superfamily)